MSVLSEQVDGRPPQPPSGRRGKRWLRAIAAGALLAAGVGASTQPVAQQAPQSHARKVKVLIISMFALEAQPWIDKLGLTQAVPVPGLSIDYPSVHCNASDVCQLTTGMGKANAASSVSALIHSGQFDLSRAYFLVAGIAGIDPSQGTLGTAAWARYLVDSDLAWEIDAREVPADWPNGFIGINTQGRAEAAAELQDGNLPRERGAAAEGAGALEGRRAGRQRHRARLPRQLPERAGQPAARRRAVRHRGRQYVLARRAARPARSRLGQAADRRAGHVLHHPAGRQRHLRGADARIEGRPARSAARGRAAHRLQLRPAVSGQTPYDSLVGSNSGGFVPSLNNLYLAGGPLVNDIVTRWSVWKHGVPSP